MLWILLDDLHRGEVASMLFKVFFLKYFCLHKIIPENLPSSIKIRLKAIAVRGKIFIIIRVIGL